MPNPISCDCIPPVRKFNYGSSQPIDVADGRTAILPREYYQDQTVEEIEVPYCKTVGAEAFKESSVTGFYAPECTTIGDSAFANCTNLCNLDLASVKTIGNSSFYNSFKDINQSVDLVLSSIEVIGSQALSECSIDYENRIIYLDITNVKELKTEALRGSPDFCFYPYYTGAQAELYLPKCEKIGDYCFYAGTSGYSHTLHTIVLPSIKTIGECAFSHISPAGGSANNCCSFVIGPNCTSIGDRILNDLWGNLDSRTYFDIYCYATTPPTLLGPFNYAWLIWWDPYHIYVPAGSVEAYKAAPNWSSYASLITAMPANHQTIDTWLI